MQSLSSLLPLLNWLTGAGAGLLASWLFDRIREDVIMPDSWRVVLFTARYARYVSLALSVVVALAATALAALIQGRQALAAVDVALASIIAAQVRHAHLSLPAEAPEVEYTDDEL